MNNPGCRLLSVPETLKRVSGALNSKLLSRGSEVPGFLRDPRELDAVDNWADSAPSLRSVPQWAGEAGAILSRGSGNILVWLAPRDGRPAAFPSQLVMDRGTPGSCFVTTWDTGKSLISGAEVCSGSPLVAGPPFDGFPLVVAIVESNAASGKEPRS